MTTSGGHSEAVAEQFTSKCGIFLARVLGVEHRGLESPEKGSWQPRRNSTGLPTVTVQKKLTISGNYGLYPPLMRTPGHGSGPGSGSYSHWSRPDDTYVCSMLARMSRCGPVAAGTRRHRILIDAAQFGTS
jgi:hypothetical protein